MKTGVKLIEEERKRQRENGKTPHYDFVENHNRELKKAAVALLTDDESEFPDKWNHYACSKMFNKPYKDRLIIAGALIAAEIDRLTLV